MVILGALGGVEWLLLGTTWAGWLLGVGLARDSLFYVAEHHLRKRQSSSYWSRKRGMLSFMAEGPRI